jgi:hypothetical protein
MFVQIVGAVMSRHVEQQDYNTAENRSQYSLVKLSDRAC